MPVTAIPLRKARDSNSTAAAFTAKIPTTTEPAHSSANGIYNMWDSGLGIGVDGRAPERILLYPYGGNDNNDIFNMRVWGWSKTPGASPVWVPQLLADLVCTLGNIDAAALDTTQFMCDTITVTYGLADERTLGLSIMSPANDVPAAVFLNIRGCEKIEFDFDLSTGCDNMNCLWRAMDNL